VSLRPSSTLHNCMMLMLMVGGGGGGLVWFLDW
jgi:hypothetical protein